MNFSLRFGKDFIRSNASSRDIFSRFECWDLGCFFNSFTVFSSIPNLLSCQCQQPRGWDLGLAYFLSTGNHQSVAARFEAFGE